MSDGGVKVGSHDTGFWDANNPIKADKKALASGLSVEQALSKAQEHDGAELVIVNADGKASVHALSVEDSFWQENKKIELKELDRDPSKKLDTSKTPLVLDNFIAQTLFGEGAFLVDEKNQSTYLGAVVDQTTPATKLKDADKFLAQPTQAKVDAAYAIAKDAGQERNVDKTVARQALAQLDQNYRHSDNAQQQVNLLKAGDAKTKVTSLITELKTLSGQESTRVSDLQGQISTRTAQWQKDLTTPTEKRNKALDAWQSANSRETKLVTTAAYNLREARMPNVHQWEQDLSQAKQFSAQKQQELSRATNIRTQEQSEVNELERLPAEAANHLQQARQLEAENRGMYVQIQSYTTLTLSQVAMQRRQVERDISDRETELSTERNKPSKPTSSPNTGSPNGVDPFNPGSNSGSPYGTDPFSGGGSQYRDEHRISELESKLRLLRTDRNELVEREDSLESISLRLAYTKDIDQLSMLFYNLDPIDRMALNQYKDRKDQNVRSISTHQSSARDKQYRYDSNINNARRSLSEASANEEGARTRYYQAEGRVANIDQDLNHLKNNPRPDTHAEVKAFATTHEKAVAQKEATVGPKAPLTVTRDKTQGVVDDINHSYNKDKSALENQIATVQQTLRQEAQGKIAQTRQQLAL